MCDYSNFVSPYCCSFYILFFFILLAKNVKFGEFGLNCSGYTSCGTTGAQFARSGTKLLLPCKLWDESVYTSLILVVHAVDQ